MTYKQIHKKNLELVNKYDLKAGDRLKFKKDYSYFKKGDIVIIEYIDVHGWVLFEESYQLPQDVESVLKIMDVIK